MLYFSSILSFTCILCLCVFVSAYCTYVRSYVRMSFVVAVVFAVGFTSHMGTMLLLVVDLTHIAFRP